MMRKVRGSWICAALVICSLSGAAVAQGPQGGQNAQGGGRRGRGMSLAMVPIPVLKTELNLNGDQVTKLTAIHDKYMTDMKAMRPQPGEQPDQSSFAKMREVSQQANTDMEAVLTSDQKAKLPDVMKTLGAMRSVGIPLAVLGDLKLTADQKQKISGIATDTQEQMRALAPEDRRTKGQELRKDAQDKVMAILTDSQKSIIDKYESEHPAPGRGGQN